MAPIAPTAPNAPTARTPRSILGRLRTLLPIVAAGLLAAAPGRTAIAQVPANDPAALDLLGATSHVVIPPVRSFALGQRSTPEQGIQIDSVSAEVTIREQTARTTLEIELRNPSGRPQPAVLLLPVPDDSVVSGFAIAGSSAVNDAKILPRDEARRIYDAIVAKLLDPALLEFAGYNLIRTSVFPVPAQGTQVVRLSYENILPTDGKRVDYILPRSESLERRRPWRITVNIESVHPISTVYSPSHKVAVGRKADGALTVRLDPAAALEPGPFRLSYLMDRGDLSASLFAYPDQDGGGYFLLMAGLPVAANEKRAPIRREVTLVIDRSGSMAGTKMDQALAAALQVIEGLEDGEAFNIVDYSTSVSSFSAAPVVKTRAAALEARAYLKTIRPGGGTNIHAALERALVQPPTDSMLPLVLFLTDGLPTIGITGEVEIREMVEQRNAHRRRVFTVGVGNDVNVPLLDRIADLTRASATYVLPDEDVEVKVAQMFRRLYGPIFAEPTIRTTDTSGDEITRVVYDLLPDEIPDLYEDDQLILIGRYRENVPITFELSGNYLGTERVFPFTFDLDDASTQNAFVPRLWASRRIATLIDQVRQAGAATGGYPSVVGVSVLDDPRYGELVDEILRLSTAFGILTEYTSFLATDGTDLGNWRDLQIGCSGSLDQRAIKTRSGLAAVNQAFNYRDGAQQRWLNGTNRYIDASLQSVECTSVQQVCDRAFFRRGNRWIDSRLIGLHEIVEPDEVIMIGSVRHTELLMDFIRGGRQGVLSLSGEILLMMNGRVVLVTDGC